MEFCHKGNAPKWSEQNEGNVVVWPKQKRGVGRIEAAPFKEHSGEFSFLGGP